MRLKVVIPILLIGALVVLAGLHFMPRQSGHPVNPEPAPPPAEAAPQTSPAQVEPPTSARKAEPVAATEVSSPESLAVKHETYVTQRCAELEDLAMDDKPESLATILGELTNRDPEIRKAAIHAAIQFGSRDAIPKLLDAASQTDDLQEKTALTEAAEFLKLPSLTELTQQAKTNAVAGGQ